MFSKEKFPLMALILSLLVLAILSRVGQMETPAIPFLFRLMLSEFAFFVAVSGIYMSYQLQKEQGRSVQYIFIAIGCLMTSILLGLEGYHLWQMLPSSHTPQTIIVNSNLQLSSLF